MIQYSGAAHCYGDHVDTDVIIPARYLNDATLPHLAKHCMIDIDAAFSTRVRPGDVLIAGKNFGCGSSREHAPLALKAAGIHCVIAKSFARIFLRNAINIGLSVIEADTDALKASHGDQIRIDLDSGKVVNLSQLTESRFEPPAAFITTLIAAGGLVPYTKLKLESAHPGGDAPCR